MRIERVLAICLFAGAVAFAQQQGAAPASQGQGGRGGGANNLNAGGLPRILGPQPPVVDPGGPGKPPSDAIVLFNGRDMTGWTQLDGKPARCTVADAVMTCRTGVGDIITTEKYRNAEIHVEFNLPNMPNEKGQARANSGILLQGRTEIQVLDVYNNPTYNTGEFTGGTGSNGPLVNAARPPEQWQSYDIVFHAAKCAADGTVQEPGSVTLLWNGVLVQDHTPIRGRGCVSEGPLGIQDHSMYVGRKINISPGVDGPAPDTTLKFRNIWMRRLPD
ncbi:MAG: DUF1080 domain-containing protein [Bryobacteraceae bacterium]